MFRPPEAGLSGKGAPATVLLFPTLNRGFFCFRIGIPLWVIRFRTRAIVGPPQLRTTLRAIHVIRGMSAAQPPPAIRGIRAQLLPATRAISGIPGIPGTRAIPIRAIRGTSATRGIRAMPCVIHVTPVVIPVVILATPGTPGTSAAQPLRATRAIWARPATRAMPGILAIATPAAPPLRVTRATWDPPVTRAMPVTAGIRAIPGIPAIPAVPPPPVIHAIRVPAPDPRGIPAMPVNRANCGREPRNTVPAISKCPRRVSGSSVRRSIATNRVRRMSS